MTGGRAAFAAVTWKQVDCARLIAVVLASGLLACGADDFYETAGIVNRSSGGDEVISEEGAAATPDSGPSLAGPLATQADFESALERAKARRENELRQIEPGGPIHRRLTQEIRAIQDKQRNAGLAFLQQRNAFVLAEGSLDAFAYQFAPDREWEVDYAVRSGDLGLAASIIQDVLARFDALEPPRPDRPYQPQEEGDLEQGEPDASIQNQAAERLKAEGQAAETLLKLAQLSIEAADFAEAERQFRACLDYQSALGVLTDARMGYAALLELLGRDDEARRMDAIASRDIDGRRP